MAAKTNASASEIDKTSYFWTGLCAVCHPGGGPGEFDRDGIKYYDETSGQFGYQVLGRTSGQVTLDGDYALINTQNGQLSAAPWDRSGIVEPDCLFCHRKDRVIAQGMNMNWIWRSASLRGGATLLDDTGNPVKGFSASATASQGWFSSITLGSVPAGSPPKATELTIDYGVGTADGSLIQGRNGEIKLSGEQIAKTPRDYACWGCHATPDVKKRGRVWFDPTQDVHYAAFNHLDDADPSNDVSALDSVACTRCHPSNGSHNFSKGSSFLGSVQNETDYASFHTCAECHLSTSSNRDPEAPAPTSAIHTQRHLETMACQFCHSPYKNAAADEVIDNATTGSSIGYTTTDFLSSNPIDPTYAGHDRWWPSAKLKLDPDGKTRIYPAKLLLSVWWGDWDDHGTPGDLSDDVVTPIALWRVRQATGNHPLPGVIDDNGDGKIEVNTEAEILVYLQALVGNDSYGNPFATRPVLVKGGKVWYADPGQLSGVNHFDYEGTGAKVESSHPFSIDHNVRPTNEALNSCAYCHPQFSGGMPNAVFDRQVLIDPFDVTGAPVYETLGDLTGIHPQ